MRKRLLMCCIIALLALAGCSEIHLARYRARGIVQVPQPMLTGWERSSLLATGLPWVQVMDLLGDVFGMVGGTRKAAIENRMNYDEFREFSLFSWTK